MWRVDGILQRARQRAAPAAGEGKSRPYQLHLRNNKEVRLIFENVWCVLLGPNYWNSL